jgi:hypothetical protein
MFWHCTERRRPSRRKHEEISHLVTEGDGEDMSMIAEIARLKELQANEASAAYKTDVKEFKYECEMLNAAPTMLEILCMIEPGDVAYLDTVLDIVHNWQHDTCDSYANEIGVLRRLQTMCRKMEEER